MLNTNAKINYQTMLKDQKCFTKRTFQFGRFRREIFTFLLHFNNLLPPLDIFESEKKFLQIPKCF